MSAVDWTKPIEMEIGGEWFPATIVRDEAFGTYPLLIEADGDEWWTSRDGIAAGVDYVVRNVVEVEEPSATTAPIMFDDQPVTARVTLDYFPMIRGWAQDRNLIAGSTPDKQMLKLVEEFGELGGALARGKDDEANDAIGDMIVVLTILAAQRGVEIEDCIAAAWDEIKDRKGRMIDGVFRKDGD